MTTFTRRRLLHAAGLGAATLALPRVPAALAAPTTTAVAIAGDPLGPGYWVLSSDGSIEARGSARAVGGAPAYGANPTGLLAHPTGGGFWRVSATGAAMGFGSAALNLPAAANRTARAVGGAATPSGTGLWRVTADGQVLAGGSAERLGQVRSEHPITAVAAHPVARGYWILDRSGEVFAFGASRVMGAPAGSGSVGLAVHPAGTGYWVVRTDGRVVAYGGAAHHGDAAAQLQAVDIAAAPDGGGYWVLGRDGRVRAFGSAAAGVITTQPPPAPELSTVRGIVVASSISRRVGALLRHAEDDGVSLGGWGHRSHARQVELRRQNCGPRYYDVYVKSSSECTPMTARPGSSQHEVGLAVDFYRRHPDGSTSEIRGTRAFKWLARNAATYGLINLPAEPWHWSTTGR